MTVSVTCVYVNGWANTLRASSQRAVPRGRCAATVLSLGLWMAAGCGAFSPKSERAHEPTRCVQGKCAEGYSCHYEHERDGGAGQLSVCRPEVGRCNSNVDCNPSQICFRDTARLGTCGQREY